MLRNQDRIEKINIKTDTMENTDFKNEVINENGLTNCDKAIYVFNKKVIKL